MKINIDVTDGCIWDGERGNSDRSPIALAILEKDVGWPMVTPSYIMVGKAGNRKRIKMPDSMIEWSKTFELKGESAVKAFSFVIDLERGEIVACSISEVTETVECLEGEENV